MLLIQWWRDQLGYEKLEMRKAMRELRKDPTLRGQIVIKLTIEPDGSVSFCALQSMDMNAPALADQHL